MTINTLPLANFTVDYLNLPGFRTRSVERVEHMLLVIAECTILPSPCPECQVPEFVLINCKDWLITDAPHFGLYPTLIQLFVPCFQCSLCNRDLVAEIPGLDYTRRNQQVEEPRPTRTTRLIDYILDRVANLETFEQIGRETRQDADAIRAIFKFEFDEWDKRRGKDLPIHTAIDEARYRHNYLGIVADARGDQGIVDVLEDEKQETFIKRFFEAENRREVQTLSTDFRTDNRYAYTKSRKNKEAALPNANVVGDRFHFSDRIGDAFDEVRLNVQKLISSQILAEEMAKFAEQGEQFSEDQLKSEALKRCMKKIKNREKGLREKRWLLFARPENVKQKDLLTVSGLLALYPDLNLAYDLKNAGLKILDAATEKEAKAAFERWEKMVDASPLKPNFDPAVKLSKKWRKELLQYIITERQIHSARIESAIFVVKIRNRMGRGISFPMLRAIVIWQSARQRMRQFPSQFDGVASMTNRKLVKSVEPYYDIE